MVSVEPGAYLAAAVVEAAADLAAAAVVHDVAGTAVASVEDELLVVPVGTVDSTSLEDDMGCTCSILEVVEQTVVQLVVDTVLLQMCLPGSQMFQNSLC